MIKTAVRSLELADVEILVGIDHSYHTDYVWQMDYNSAPREVKVFFREVRLPRSMHVDYPRDHLQLINEWEDRFGLLVAEVEDKPVGYISLSKGSAPQLVAVTDLVVSRRVRRQGVAMALVLAAQTWTDQFNASRMVLEMQTKNYPAICLANKLGFEFCGYSDDYFPNQDIALFFSKRL